MTGDLGVLLAFAVMLSLHEWRAVNRDRRLRGEISLVTVALDQNRHLTLSAVDQRTRVETRTDALETITAGHAERIATLEQSPLYR